MPKMIKFMPTLPENVKNILKNTDGLNEQEILYFCRIIFSLPSLKGFLNDISNKRIYIDRFEIEYNALSEKEKMALSMRFGKEDNLCYTYEEIFKKFGKSRQYSFLIINELFIKLDLLSSIFVSNCTEGSKTSITTLKLSTTAFNTLARNGVLTIQDLNKLSEYDISKMKGISKENIQKLKPYLSIVITDQSAIETLNLSARANNALHQYGISTIKDFKNLNPDEIYKINRIGDKTLIELLFKLKELKNITNSIYNLNLSHRALNVLYRNGITNIDELKKINKQNILDFRNVGIKTASEIISILSEISS